MEIEIKPKTVTKVNAKTLKICAKVRDCFSATLLDANGTELHDHDGYVPSFMPGNHHGDYVMLDIDIDTGVITNWKKPDADTLSEWVNGAEED